MLTNSPSIQYFAQAARNRFGPLTVKSARQALESRIRSGRNVTDDFHIGFLMGTTSMLQDQAENFLKNLQKEVDEEINREYYWLV